MSGSTASRYIGGVPYGPGRSVGRYPNAASVGAAPGVSPGLPGLGAVGSSGTGGLVTPVSSGGAVGAPSGGGGGGGGNLLASLLGGAGLLQYLPDAYDALFGGDPYYGPGENVFEPGSTFTGPGGVQIPSAALGGIGSDWGQVFEPGWTVDQTATQALLDAPMPAGDQFAGHAGDVVPGAAGASPGGWGAAIDAAGGWDAAVRAGTLPTDLGLSGSLGSLPGVGDVALGLGDLAGGLAGSWMASGAFKNSRNPNAQYGQQIGSTLGAIAGSFIPIPILGTMAGAALGGAAGGKIGNEIGPAPTVGRNFSSIGTFGADGNLGWGNSGGDNGGTAADATGFSNWFGQNLLAMAGQNGLTFNPNMAGAQIRVGGYDNFSRRFTTPGGYFYTPDTGGSPENYALRPSDDWASGGFGADQANAFARNVLADLTARGAFIRPGEQGQGLDHWGVTQGAPLGWYGSENGDYSRIQSGGGDFNSILGDRQGAITGWTNQQQAIAQQQAAAQAQLDQSNRWAGQNVGFDPMTMLNAQNDPGMASVMGLGGVQWGENGPMFTSPAPGGASAYVQADGGA